MRIADRRPEEKVENPGQDRVAHVAMQPGHRAGENAAPEPIAHDQVIARPQLLDERLERCEIVRIVRVAHDDIAPSGGLNSRPQSMAVTLPRDIDDPGAMLSSDLL
jgi:hypothetical protein